MGLPARLCTGINTIPTKCNSIYWKTIVPVAMSNYGNEHSSRPSSGYSPIPQSRTSNITSGPGPSSGRQSFPSERNDLPPEPLLLGGSVAQNDVGSLYYSAIPANAAAQVLQPKAIQKKYGPRPVTKWTQMYGKTYRGDWQQTDEEFAKHLAQRNPNVGEEIHDAAMFDNLFPGLDEEFPRNRSQVSGNFRPLWADSESEGITPPRSPARLSSIYRTAFPQGVPSNMPAELQQAIMAAAMPVPNTATFRRASLAERISKASGIAVPPPSPKSADQSATSAEEVVAGSTDDARRKRRTREPASVLDGIRMGPLGPTPIVRSHFIEPMLPPREFADNAPTTPSPEYLFGNPQVTVLGQTQQAVPQGGKEDAAKKQPEF